MVSTAAPEQRWRLRARGAVQGVGFRPWCVQQGAVLGLSGWVRNDAQGVLAEVQGPPAALQRFVQGWRACPLPLARVDAVECETIAPDAGAAPGLAILASDTGGALATGLPPDSAPCDACLDELFDPADRRHRHAFINCTHCGPRFSVTARLPYDRPATSMAGFAMCAACAAEYHDPANRRYHAQPTACPSCGPRLALWDGQGRALPGDPLAQAVARLQAGEVVAVKGVGGYHLMADARQPAALERLRQAKQRRHKPFALLVPNVASARRWVRVDDEAARWLSEPGRPIVVLPCQPGVQRQHPLIAPDLDEWGLMLPSSPLQWLMIHEALGRPVGPAWREAGHALLWVATSANLRGEPLVHTEAQALEQLAGLADALLVHDRPIVSPLDDSVRRPLGAGHAPFVRRARGWVPEPIAMPGVAPDAPSVLATGGWLKNTVCVTRGSEAFVSPHGGDLGSAATRALATQAVERLVQFLGVRPSAVAHDLHPDFFSTQHAVALARQWSVPAVAVQHHLAHAAAVVAEHGVTEPCLALVLDGTGLGTDGQVWGGELLRLDATDWQRLGHLPRLALVGGDRAAAEPWRMAAAVLAAAGRGDEITARFADEPAAAMMADWLRRPAAARALTSSAGRWFDAAAALIAGVRHHSHEAHAAVVLEAMAQRALDRGPVQPWSAVDRLDAAGQPDGRALCERLSQVGGDTAQREQAAAEFHLSLAALLQAWVRHHARHSGLRTVVLGGGCWVNRCLRNAVVDALQGAGLHVLEARHAPPGDGGLSLGQAAWALRTLATAPARPVFQEPCTS